MPDITQNPEYTISNFSPEVSYMPDTGMPKMDDLDNWQNQLNMQDLGPTGKEYAQSISSGETITDLIKDVQDLQAKGMAMLNNSYSSVPNSPSPGGFNPDAAFQDLSRKLNPETPSLQVSAKPVIIGKSSDYARYKDSPYFQTFGYTPNLGSEQEYKYGNAQTWGQTIGNALAGGAHLAADTFVEGWKGWGRMTEALFTWDSDKLMGTPEEREEMARKQNELMSKYAIYDTAESKDSLWNRQLFGNMLQQSGFAVGAIGQFALEEFLTAGMASFVEPALKGVMVGRVARSAEELAALKKGATASEKAATLAKVAEGNKSWFKPRVSTTADELINSTRQVANTVTKSERVVNALADGLKTLTPGYGTVEEMIKLNRAGAGFAQLAYTGLGGIKRGLSEFNMSRSESIFEAASTYTQLKDRLTEDFIKTNGREPSEDELERIKQSAEDASHDNFMVNMGVLSVMNRIQFDNMFKQFSKSRTLLGEGAAQLKGKAFQVTGKIEGKTGARVYKEGLFGRLGALPQIAKTFGKKEAAWQATKAVGKGLMKFEGSEGMQELIQNASSTGLDNYYYDLYHGKKGYTGELDAVVNNIQNPLTDMDGMKTFLMGALTGRLIAPMSFGISKTTELVRDRKNAKKAAEKFQLVKDAQIADYTKKNGKAPEGEDLAKIEAFAKTSTEYKTLSQHVDESVGLLNALYSNPQWLKNEALANIKVNNKAAATMDEAAANQDRYVFNNAKDSALAKTIASAIKLDLYSSLRDVIKEYGVEFSDQDFQQAFGMEATEKNRGNAKKLSENVVAQIEDYYDTYKKLKDKYADRIIPELYKNNDPEDYKNAQLQKAVLDNVIEMIATNSFKSKRAIARASELQNEISQNKAIGSSAIEILTKLGSELELKKHARNLERQLNQMKFQETPLTIDQKELYESITEELKHIKDWNETKNELINEIDVDRSYRAYAGLINLFNKRAGNTAAVSREDVEDTFLKFKDYIKLNADSKEYVDAMNLLADPKNMKLVYQAQESSFKHMFDKFYEEQIGEIEEATGVPVPRHRFEKEADDTYKITSPDGVVVAKGIATMEEAKIKANELDAAFREELAKQEAETKAKEEEAVVTEEEEVKTTEETTAKNLIADINKAKNQAELDKLKETDTSAFTDAEKDEIEKAITDKEDELQANAIKAGTIKTISDTDPEFVTAYNEALDKIEEVTKNPNVTIDEIRKAFAALSPIFARLEPAVKAKYNKEFGDKRKAVEDRIKAEAESKDIEGAKALITKSLASDSTPLNISFQTLYQQLNLKLKPEFKQEAIDHFEKEYIKAIDRKVNKLLSEINTSNTTEALTKLIMLSGAFRDKVEKSLEIFKQKSEQLRDVRGTSSFLIEVDPTFDNPVHRGIVGRKDGEATPGQLVTIENFMISGMLSQEDLYSYDTNSKHGASKVINLAVARMLTLQINKAAVDHFEKNDSGPLKQVLTNYLNDSMVGIKGYTKEDLKNEVNDLLDKDHFPTIDDLLQGILLHSENSTGIPKTREISKEEYKLIGAYRNAISTIMRDSNILSILDDFSKYQQNLIASGAAATSQEIIPFDLVKSFDDYLIKDESGKVDVKAFYEDLIQTFDKLKEVKTSVEALKMVRELSAKHMSAGGDGLSMLQSLFAGSLQTDNLLKSDSDGSEPLSEEEIVQILDGTIEQSLNKEQISQVEKYAKTQKLEEYKQKFKAAVGYTNTDPVFTADRKTPTVTGPTFNSLRPKFPNDLRTAQDLAVYLMPDENGFVQTKYALTFIAYSSYATPAEKMLAKKLLDVVSDEDTIKIDNTIEAAGEFDPETNEVAINLEAAGYKKDRPSVPVETVILHELIHGVTEKAISDPNSAYSKEIRTLYNLVKTKEGANTFYAYSDTLSPEEQLREFVTEAFTNPSFQHLLATTPYGEQTLWDKFVDFVNSILEAIGVDVNNTALGRVISLTEQLLNKEALIEADTFPSEQVMDKIKVAKAEEDITKIREEIEANKDKYTPDMYHALDAALKNKLKSINARKMSDVLKQMKSLKIDKTIYYYTDDAGVVKVYKRGRAKINEVKNADIINRIKEEIAKTAPKPEPTEVVEEQPTGKGVKIVSDLSTKEFVEDPSTLDFSTVDPTETITAVDPNGLRSKGNDGRMVNGTYTEYDSFTKYYSKVRSIINKLAMASPEELDRFYVTLDMDSAGLRWDGSSEDAGWQAAQKGVIGYISDKDGNPIVFDKNGKAIGKADKNDPASSRFNTGENQIVYFNTYTENTDKRSLDRIEKESLAKIFAARKAVMEGRPQIAKLQKVTKGQMVLGAMVKPKGKSQKNTARDKDLAEQMNQDHVSLELVGGQLNAFIEDADGAINRTALFTPSSRSVKVVGAEGQTYTLFDHLIELMKVYHQMAADKDPNIGDVQRDLVKFAQNMWLTGDRYTLKIPKNFMGIWIKVKGDKDIEAQVRLPIFEMKDGILTINENNLKAVKNHVEDMKINVAKIWLEGKEDFKFPYIVEKDGKKMITFEKKDYKDFLVNQVGLITYISDIPTKENIRRYNSSVHFLEPTDLTPKAPAVTVTQKQVVDNKDASKKAVDNATDNAAAPKDQNIPDPSKKRRFKAPSYEQTYQETYEKICK